MSSTINTAHLESKDLKMLQEVLVSCGYKGDISKNPEGELNLAARLIIKLFQQGLREPAQLTNAIHRNFGSAKAPANVIHFSGLHRNGVTPQARVH